MNIFYYSEVFSQLKRTVPLGPLTALESVGPYFEIMGESPGPTINLKAYYINTFCMQVAKDLVILQICTGWH